MGLDGKYGRITTEHGDIPDDEPVFLFRAKDQLLPVILRHYMVLCKEAGSPPEHVRGLDRALAKINDWQAVNYTQVPGTKREE